jgi:hypothetical protein
MRRALLAVRLVCCLAPIPIAAACGGGKEQNSGSKTPDTAGSSSAGSDSSGAASDGGPTTTTTTTLPDGGDLQGAQLSETHTVASTTGSTAPTPKGPHTHDPGRGIEDIKAIVVAHRPDARACYDKALPAHPGIQGDLVVQWTIDPKGNVTKISLDTSKSSITEPSVVSCVMDVIKAITFAASPGGFETNASYPFKFTPKK